MPDAPLPGGALIRHFRQFGIILTTNGDDWENVPPTTAIIITLGPGVENGRLLYDAATNLSVRVVPAPLCERVGSRRIRLVFDPTGDGRMMLALNASALRIAFAHAALGELLGPTPLLIS